MELPIDRLNDVNTVKRQKQRMFFFTSKQRAEADRAAGEEIRKKACEQLKET